MNSTKGDPNAECGVKRSFSTPGDGRRLCGLVFGGLVMVAVAGQASAQQAKPTSGSSPAASSSGSGAGAGAPGSDANTAQELSNPLSSIISVPLQNNIDFGGANGRARYTANLEPVVPIKLTDKLTLISRTVVPFVGTHGNTGFGNVAESLFLSPATVDGFTFGAGPVIQIPTASKRTLGSRQLGLGPTAVVVKKSGAVLLGLLANHVWGVTGPHAPSDRLSNTFIQPFGSYTWPSKTTLVVNTETSYNWIAHQWTVPINVFVNQLVKIGKQQVQFGAGPRYFADRPAGGQRWGIRLNVSLVFPDSKKAS